MGLFNFFKKTEKEVVTEQIKEIKKPEFETLDSELGPVLKVKKDGSVLYDYDEDNLLDLEDDPNWPDDPELFARSARAYIENKVYEYKDKPEVSRNHGLRICLEMIDREYADEYPQAYLYSAESSIRDDVSKKEFTFNKIEDFCIEEMEEWCEYALEDAELSELQWYFAAYANWYNGIVHVIDEDDNAEDALKWTNGNIEKILEWCRMRVEIDQENEDEPVGLMLLRHYLVLSFIWEERRNRENIIQFWERMWHKYHLDEVRIQLMYAERWLQESPFYSGEDLMDMDEIDFEELDEDWYEVEVERAKTIVEQARCTTENLYEEVYEKEIFGMDEAMMMSYINECGDVSSIWTLLYFLLDAKPDTDIKKKRIKNMWAVLAVKCDKIACNSDEELWNIAFQNAVCCAKHYIEADKDFLLEHSKIDVETLLKEVENKNPEALCQLGDLYYNKENVHCNEDIRRKIGDILLTEACNMYLDMESWSWSGADKEKYMIKRYQTYRYVKHKEDIAMEILKQGLEERLPYFCYQLSDRIVRQKIKKEFNYNMEIYLKIAGDAGYPVEKALKEAREELHEEARSNNFYKQKEYQEAARLAELEIEQKQRARNQKLDEGERMRDIMRGGLGYTAEELYLMGKISYQEYLRRLTEREMYW